MHRRSLLIPVVIALLIPACQDSMVRPVDPVDDIGRDIDPPPASRPFSNGPEGYAIAGELRTGWIVGRTGQPAQVTYEVHDGLAIWEGDIVLGAANLMAATREQLSLSGGLRLPGTVSPSGVVIVGANFRWPNGVVPYTIDPALTNQARVTNAIAMVEQETPGVTLVPRNGEDDYVTFRPASGCSSPIGMQGGQQFINLANGCTTGNTAHEILHALGMYHEHSRCDRDDFVEVMWDEIEEDREHNFVKECLPGAIDLFDYDEGSMMHYGTHGFAIGTNPTLVSKRGLDHLMGQRDSLGPTDVQTIEALYGQFNQPPVAVIAPLAASYPEGSPVQFDGSGSSDPDDAVLLYSWTFGDGTCAGASPPAKCSMASPSHTYADDGVYTVTLTVSDRFLDDQASVEVTVTNVAPVVNAGPDATRDEGSQFTQNGSFVDPGDDVWTATVDYGDGSGVQALALTGKNFTLSHTYIDNGSYTVTVTVSDDDGGVGDDQLTVTVLNVDPTVDAGADAEVTSGEMYHLVGSFSDPGIIDFTWNWTVDWGFGMPAAGSTDDQSAPINASTQVCAAGTYQVVLSVTDKDGGMGTDALTLTVPYYAVDIEIMPGSNRRPINMGQRGVLPVAILSTADFDARDVDPASVMLGDETDPDTPVAQRNNGTWRTSIEDVNGDGLPDLVVMFDVPSLVANGDLTAGTTELVLRGFMSNACTNFRGAQSVVIVP
jgi:PKD repeat protein